MKIGRLQALNHTHKRLHKGRKQAEPLAIRSLHRIDCFSWACLHKQRLRVLETNTFPWRLRTILTNCLKLKIHQSSKKVDFTSKKTQASRTALAKRATINKAPMNPPRTSTCKNTEHAKILQRHDWQLRSQNKSSKTIKTALTYPSRIIQTHSKTTNMPAATKRGTTLSING